MCKTELFFGNQSIQNKTRQMKHLSKAHALLMLRKKEEVKLSQTFTQKKGGGELQEGKVTVLTPGGVKEKEIKCILLSLQKHKG